MSLNTNLSDQAKKVLNGYPFKYLDRSKNNLNFFAVKQGSLLTLSNSTLERYGSHVLKEQIAGVPCLIVQPSNYATDYRILYIFGGGFVSGSAFEDLTIAAPIADFTKAEVVMPEYRLAPENPWPAAVNDVFKVYETLVEKPFVLVGESAGNLALCVVLQAKRLDLTARIVRIVLTLVQPKQHRGKPNFQ